MTLVDHNGEAVPVRWSWLSRFAQSAAHARHAALRGKDPTPAMKLGTAVHAAVFEPHRLVLYAGGEKAVIDKKGKTTVKTYTDVKQGGFWEEFKAAQAPDAVIINARELAHAQAVAAALVADPIAAPLLFGDGVIHERKIEWARHGRSCTSTPDARKPGEWIVDLKTCRSALPSQFVRAATWAGYPGQLAFYQEADAFDAALDEPRADLYIVAVEPFPPYAVTTFRLDDFAIDLGRRTIAAYWNAMAACEASDYWPGYAQSAVTFTADDPDQTFGPMDIEPDAENDNHGDDGADDNRIDWSAA